jgi:intracellular septation protein
LALSKQTTVWIRTGVDYASLLAFVGTLIITHDFQRATWVLMGTSVVALAVGWITERRLAPIPLLTGVSALVFGTLTLVFHDKSFVKMKMTFVDATLAIVLFIGFFIKRNPLKALIGDNLTLPDEAWRILSVRYALFFTASAMCNEAVWRTQSDARWGLFRIAAVVAAVIFSLTQAPFLMKHMTPPPEEPPVLDPPDAGF